MSSNPLPEPALSEWNALWRDVVNLHGQWKLYIDLYGNQKHVSLMHDMLPDVFGLVQTALRHEITMAHGRLLDPPKSMGKDNISFSRFLQTVESHCPAALNEKLKKMLDEVQDHCSPILHWRNKRVAHNDYKTVFAIDQEKLPDIERAEIEKGLSMLGNLLNEIDLHFNQRTTPFEYVLMRDTGGDLMRYLQRALDADAEESIRRIGFDPRSHTWVGVPTAQGDHPSK
jgi:hypothetical protein